MIKEILVCDICHTEKEVTTFKNVPVIEGNDVKPIDLEMCDKDREKMLKQRKIITTERKDGQNVFKL